jgi:hypothetical protein
MGNKDRLWILIQDRAFGYVSIMFGINKLRLRFFPKQ